eukprot:2711913-Pyramimonas_sp.AAC.1
MLRAFAPELGSIFNSAAVEARLGPGGPAQWEGGKLLEHFEKRKLLQLSASTIGQLGHPHKLGNNRQLLRASLADALPGFTGGSER